MEWLRQVVGREPAYIVKLVRLGVTFGAARNFNRVDERQPVRPRAIRQRSKDILRRFCKSNVFGFSTVLFTHFAAYRLRDCLTPVEASATVIPAPLLVPGLDASFGEQYLTGSVVAKKHAGYANDWRLARAR